MLNLYMEGLPKRELAEGGWKESGSFFNSKKRVRESPIPASLIRSRRLINVVCLLMPHHPLSPSAINPSPPSTLPPVLHTRNLLSCCNTNLLPSNDVYQQRETMCVSTTLSELWPLIYAKESTFQKCKMIQAVKVSSACYASQDVKTGGEGAAGCHAVPCRPGPAQGSGKNAGSGKNTR
jgi:hypothetical protein